MRPSQGHDVPRRDFSNALRSSVSPDHDAFDGAVVVDALHDLGRAHAVDDDGAGEDEDGEVERAATERHAWERG